MDKTIYTNVCAKTGHDIKIMTETTVNAKNETAQTCVRMCTKCGASGDELTKAPTP
jgi:hypothetical protein